MGSLRYHRRIDGACRGSGPRLLARGGLEVSADSSCERGRNSSHTSSRLPLVRPDESERRFSLPEPRWYPAQERRDREAKHEPYLPYGSQAWVLSQRRQRGQRSFIESADEPDFFRFVSGTQ